jgi:hypothetical protein
MTLEKFRICRNSRAPASRQRRARTDLQIKVRLRGGEKTRSGSDAVFGRCRAKLLAGSVFEFPQSGLCSRFVGMPAPERQVSNSGSTRMPRSYAKDRSIASWPVPDCTTDGMGMTLSRRCGCAAARVASKRTALTIRGVRMFSIERNIVARNLRISPWPGRSYHLLRSSHQTTRFHTAAVLACPRPCSRFRSRMYRNSGRPRETPTLSTAISGNHRPGTPSRDPSLRAKTNSLGRRPIHPCRKKR